MQMVEKVVRVLQVPLTLDPVQKNFRTLNSTHLMSRQNNDDAVVMGMAAARILEGCILGKSPDLAVFESGPLIPASVGEVRDLLICVFKGGLGT
jgi:hypothetical protein